MQGPVNRRAAITSNLEWLSVWTERDASAATQCSAGRAIALTEARSKKTQRGRLSALGMGK